MTDLAAADVRGVTDPPVDYQRAPPVVTHFYNSRFPVLAASAVLATVYLASLFGPSTNMNTFFGRVNASSELVHWILSLAPLRNGSSRAFAGRPRAV
jgi:hypothetical protein